MDTRITTPTKSCSAQLYGERPHVPAWHYLVELEHDHGDSLALFLQVEHQDDFMT
jgi:hypothetical protein